MQFKLMKSEVYERCGDGGKWGENYENKLLSPNIVITTDFDSLSSIETSVSSMGFIIPF